MTKKHAILFMPLLMALLGTIFCFWSAMGNDVNFCVTTGCTLYQDFNIAGISMWWIGAGAFIALLLCAMFGLPWLGRLLAALFIFGDIWLLLLMMLTAPCVSCLVAAFFFAMCYVFFRREDNFYASQDNGRVQGKSPLLWIWLILFVINVGQVARSQIDVWPILDESGEARARMFFSPSCPFCVEGINVLYGNVNMAFYPVAETDEDVYRLLKMRDLLAQGMNLAEAFGQSENAPSPGFFASLSPDILLFRLRLLCNKAHVFAAGSQGVPFFEYRGLPASVREKVEERHKRLSSPATGQASDGASAATPRDAAMPLELGDGQCGGAVPCPPVN